MSPLLWQGSNPYRASPLIRGSLHSSILDPLTAQLQSPKSLGSPQLVSPLGLGNSSSEIQRLNEEVLAAKTKLASWEDSWAQAKQACDAWKKEAEESAKKAKQADQDKLEAIIKKEEVSLLLKHNRKLCFETFVLWYNKILCQLVIKNLTQNTSHKVILFLRSNSSFIFFLG